MGSIQRDVLFLHIRIYIHSTSLPMQAMRGGGTGKLSHSKVSCAAWNGSAGGSKGRAGCLAVRTSRRGVPRHLPLKLASSPELASHAAQRLAITPPHLIGSGLIGIKWYIPPF